MPMSARLSTRMEFLNFRKRRSRCQVRQAREECHRPASHATSAVLSAELAQCFSCHASLAAPRLSASFSLAVVAAASLACASAK
jgi:hypothetical protein